MSDYPDRIFAGPDATWNADPIEPCMTEFVRADVHNAEVLRLRDALDDATLRAEVRGRGCECGDDHACAIARERDALRAENADMRGELIDRWRDHLRGGGVSVCDWSYPGRITERRLAAQLHKLGIVEKHPDREAYRFITKGGE